MSTLWTPDGERPIRRSDPAGSESPPPSAPPSPGDAPGSGGGAEPDDAEMQARMAELSEQMANTPAEVVVANHAYGLFELAALHLSREPPQLDQARIAIDGLAVLVEGMAGRLGEAEAQLGDGLGQLRMAYVQIAKAAATEPPPP